MLKRTMAVTVAILIAVAAGPVAAAALYPRRLR